MLLHVEYVKQYECAEKEIPTPPNPPNLRDRLLR